MLLAVVLFVPRASADAPTLPPLDTPTAIAAYVKTVQREYGLGDDFYDTLEYESYGFQNIQSKVKNKRGPNGRENSWGVCQINLNPKGHPEITKEQAMSPEWCIDWTASEFLAGRAWQWTGWIVVRERQTEP